MRFIAITLAVTLCLTMTTACSKTEETSSDVAFSSSTQPAAAPAPAPAAEATTAASGAQNVQIVRSASTSDAISIELTPAPGIRVLQAGATTILTSDMKDSGKRKYYDAAGAQIAEVKASDGGFKVRTPDGNLLWKVKIADDKIKVSDNEENLHPWVLKTGYPDKAKVLDGAETEIGEVRFANPPSPTRVRNATGSDVWTVESGTASAAWGVLLMDSVPLNHQSIIITELLARGR